MTIRVEPLTPGRTGDWLAFFDGSGFDDNPDWRPCYCMFFHFEGTNEAWAEFCSSGRSRAAQSERIATGGLRGFLAYDGDAAVGWLNAAPRSHYPKLDSFCPIEDGDRTGDLTCFVIAATHRRRGIARALLDAACAQFAQEGLTVAEAFPPKNPEDDAENFRGPRSLYERAGFAQAGDLPRHWQMRRALA